MRAGRTLQIVALACALAVAERAAAKKSPLKGDLERELVGKVFTTQVSLGWLLEYRDEALRKDMYRPVITELHPGGRLKYSCCWGTPVDRGGTPDILGAILNKSYYVDAARISMIQPRREIRVDKVKLHDDRIELQISAPGSQDAARLHVILWDGYQSTATAESLMPLIANAFRIEKYEQLRAVEAEVAALEGKLTGARDGHRAAHGSAPERYRAAEALQAVLSDLERTQSELEKLGRPAPKRTEYARERAELEATLPSLKEAALKEQLAEAEAGLSKRAGEMDPLRIRLGTKAVSARDMRERQTALQRMTELLDEQKALYAERTRLGSSASSVENARVEDDLRLIAKVRSELEAQRPAIERARLEDEYQQLLKRIQSAKNAYTQAFGTPAQSTHGAELLTVLQEARSNRLTASKAGNSGAGAQAATLAVEIDRVHHQLGR
jgi:hypothetical protein